MSVPSAMSTNRRIDFIVAGIQKAGTTTLDALLRLHPSISMPRWKELHFFNDGRNFPDGQAPSYDRYHAHWDWTRTDAIRGEITPSYLAFPGTIARISRYSPELRIVCILRDPVKRAYSAWNHQVQKGRERTSFHRALLAEDDRVADLARRDLEDHGNFRYRGLGEYAAQLESLWREFPKERTLVLRLDALAREPGPTLDALTDFLGVPRHDFGRISRKHARPTIGDMHPDSSRWLLERLEPDIARLERHLGWDCSPWRRPHGSRARWAVGEGLRRAALPLTFMKPPLERMRKRIGAYRRSVAQERAALRSGAGIEIDRQAT